MKQLTKAQRVAGGYPVSCRGLLDSQHGQNYRRIAEHNSKADGRTRASRPGVSKPSLRDLPCKRLELDEMWCFAYCKDKNLPDRLKGDPGVGSRWTRTAMDAETKLIVSWQLGARDAANAHRFIGDLAERLANRVQLTTDGNRVYVDAVEAHMGGSVDYAMLIKQYGQDQNPERAYSPAKCLEPRSGRSTAPRTWPWFRPVMPSGRT